MCLTRPQFGRWLLTRLVCVVMAEGRSICLRHWGLLCPYEADAGAPYLGRTVRLCAAGVPVGCVGCGLCRWCRWCACGLTLCHMRMSPLPSPGLKQKKHRGRWGPTLGPYCGHFSFMYQRLTHFWPCCSHSCGALQAALKALTLFQELQKYTRPSGCALMHVAFLQGKCAMTVKWDELVSVRMGVCVCGGGGGGGLGPLRSDFAKRCSR